MDLEAKPNVIKILLRNPHLNNFSKSTLALTLFEEFQFSFSYVWFWQEEKERAKWNENSGKLVENSKIFNKSSIWVKAILGQNIFLRLIEEFSVGRKKNKFID